MPKTSSPQRNSRYYFEQVRAANQKDKPALFLQYCLAAIAERARGEIELYQVGNQIITLAGGISLPPAKLFPKPLSPSERLLSDIYQLAGSLDMAAQGDITKEADEELWRRFMLLVNKYSKQLIRRDRL